MSKHKRHGDRSARRSEFMAPGRRGPAVSWNAVLIAVAIVFLGVVLLKVTAGSSRAPGRASSAEAIATGQDLVRPASTFADGRARFYRYTTAAGPAVNLFVLRSSDGVVRAAVDACAVCYRERRGYRQEGDNMVCNNCGRAFPSADVNVITGGCNPIALERSLDGDQVVIRSAALEAAAAYF